MSQGSDNASKAPGRLRVLVVDGAHLPAAALERLASAGVDLVDPATVVCQGQLEATRITPEMLPICVVEHMEPPVPFHLQGRHYDNVFRRPRGRPRR